ncbi:MAG: DMT family transporter [Spirochaetales bacterium]|nr:DMT family transporter [Spirochaetales bacterium]
MVFFYALLSALSYGAADFLGGLSSRRNSALTVVAWSQAAGLFVALGSIPLLGGSRVTSTDILWGIGAGITGAAGVGLLFRGLADGLASVVSPLAALVGAALPVLFGLLTGERPSVLTWSGIALALPAIVLLSLEKGDRRGHVLPSLRLGMTAGMAFGGFFILIAQTGEESGMWPLLAARCATVPLFILIALSSGKKLIPAKGTGVTVVISGALDMLANIFYLLAARSGLLILAVVLTALYPGPTVFLQRLVLKEKLTLSRLAGLILAIAGAALMGAGG